MSIATISEYGPNNQFCSKIVAAVVNNDDIVAMKKWYGDGQDLRYDPVVAEEIKRFFSGYAPARIVTTGKVIGCPHEEGIDYPEHEKCPECKYWWNRDRFTNELDPVN